MSRIDHHCPTNPGALGGAHGAGIMRMRGCWRWRRRRCLWRTFLRGLGRRISCCLWGEPGGGRWRIWRCCMSRGETVARTAVVGHVSASRGICVSAGGFGAVMLAQAKHGFRVECAGLENMAAATAGASAVGMPGVILLTAHFGNAEIGIPYLPMMGFPRPIHIVMYQDSKDAQERFHTRHRKLLANLDIISTTDPVAAGLGIIAAIRKGDTVAMRADRTMAGKGIEVTLLGQAGDSAGGAVPGGGADRCAGAVHLHVPAGVSAVRVPLFGGAPV